MERHEVAPKICAAVLVEASRQSLGRPVAVYEHLPRRLPVAVVIDAGTLLELEVERAPEQLSDPFRLAPVEWRGRRGGCWRWHVGPHHLKHFEHVAVGRPGEEAQAAAPVAH